MFQIKNKINFFLILLNIFFLIYYSTQLLVFTDEFAKNNIGFFNHAIAGLSEIIGLIFFCLAIGLVLVILRGPKNQLPLLATIYLIQLILSLNFWRYVITDSPGETSIEIIMLNAHIFSLTSFSMLILLLRLKKYI
jgi:hypothetical protein|tara:strand:+ start:119 stop:526 length:408 start_codon:yes stop_codon:yes gene_type:complete